MASQHHRAQTVAEPVHHGPRRAALGAARRVGEIALELRFLALQGIAPGLLLAAAAEATRLGVSPESALMGLDFPEELFYRLLARHLGVPYLERPMRLAPSPGSAAPAASAGFYHLAANPQGLDRVLAPRGPDLRRLLREVPAGQGRAGRFCICSPRRLAGLLRLQDRAALQIRASRGLADWDAGLSAEAGPSRAQIWAGVVLVCGALVGSLICPALLAWFMDLSFALLFFCHVLLRLAATAASREPPPGAAADIAEADLPLYTVVVPLYRETRIVGTLIEALERIDYPRAKLDIKIMLEAEDSATILAVEALRLPARYEVIVVPPGQPRTKPRALNVALDFARGTLITVYDAEDRPDPDQLRRAAALFATLPAEVACLQARLACDHAEECWITQMFALEYAGLFGAVLPGLAALRLPVPLGGTSNHFRCAVVQQVGGWDAWNVTEDIDLGFRLARFGFRVAALDSVTGEEAPITLRAWMKQRSRWLKGWMITALVHGRAPRRLWREVGPTRAGAMVAALGGTILGCLFGPVFVARLLIDAGEGRLLPPGRPLEALWHLFCLLLMILGLIGAIWPVWRAAPLGKRKWPWAWLLGYSLYLGLVSLAAWRALFECCGDPHGWSKTEHGLANRRRA